ncbi:hypothetical protein [Basilea psittacipulmonis]|uniref:Uncharacterized protein n=1 Tax=Basilea psittacipulmonis DSM 24701 TaxID=1072685 RepID=A0A077DHD2_9BURK|nr:hypothetical protein [Basilea psittacipulmonis]AIL32553.1 hypothetical protein IX83_03835 [Basilea psittacipulmonis DSM 24701]
MKKIITGTLPPKTIMQALFPQIQQKAPYFANYLKKMRAVRSDYLPTCGQTPLEWISQKQFTAPYQNGLIIQAVHIQFTQDGYCLTQPPVSEEEHHQIQTFCQEILADTHATLSPIGTGLWYCPVTYPAPAMTTDSIAQQLCVDWWPQDPIYRPIRQFMNEFQMRWHQLKNPTHEQKLNRCNSVWIYDAAVYANTQSDFIYRELEETFYQQNWEAWLHQLSRLDELFREASSLYLCASDRVYLFEPRTFIQKLLPQKSRNLSWYL